MDFQRAVDLLQRTETLAIGLGLAAFLALYWVVRGAPVGQRTAPEPAGAPSPGRRDRAVATAVAGALLIPLGAVVAFRDGIPWSLPAFAGGFGLILAALAASRPHRHVSPTLRRVVEFSNATMTAAVVGGILVVGNVFAFKYGGRPIDFTRDEAFTLSSLSVNQVKALPAPLKMTLLLGRDGRTASFREQVRRLAGLYRAESPSRVAVEEIFPYGRTQAGAFEALAKRVPDVNVVQGDAIVLEYGPEGSVVHAVIPVADLFRPAAGGGGSVATRFNGEDVVTSTIARFREGRRGQVGFVGGHGEPSLVEFDPRQGGLGSWRARIGSAGLDAIELNLLKDEIPAEIELIAVVAPRGRYQDQEVAKLKAFLARGKPMLVAMNGEGKAGLDDLLALYDVAIEPATVRDPSLNLGGRSDLLVVPPIRKGDHPIVDSLVDQFLFLPQPSPLRALGQGTAQPPAGIGTGPAAPARATNPAMVPEPFLRAAVTAVVPGRAEVTRTGERREPPILGLAVSERAEVAGNPAPSPRMVVLSSGLMAVNWAIESSPANADLLMNAIQWLRGKSESLGVAPKVYSAPPFTADPNLRARLHLVPTVLSVVLILGFGVTTYLARRN